MCFCVILVNHSQLFDVILKVLSSAFSEEAVGGGVIGFLSSRALKQGFARGILSNEAGIGTSATAHARASERLPSEAGLYGMAEVFFDTLLLCPLTALAVLCSGVPLSSTDSPMSLISRAFYLSLGDGFSALLPLLVFAFGFSTVICWYYYGSGCSSELFGKIGSRLFLPVYLLFIFLGVLLDNSLILYLTDLIILMMFILTTALLVCERRKIIEETKRGGLL